jgi:hypothetical protein
MRFDMAKTLVKRAEERAAWIGDDHGDPYEEALVTGTVSAEMKIALKEILDHLRSALDYAAREIWERSSGLPVHARVYFPITARNFNKKDFGSLVGRQMPGVPQSRPDLLAVLESLQPFMSSKNGWLADLGTLANKTKHEQLMVNHVTALQLKTWRDEQGLVLSSAKKADGTPYSPGVLMLLGQRVVPPADDVLYDGPMYYLCLTPIDQELLTFLRVAIPGVLGIVTTLESAL